MKIKTTSSRSIKWRSKLGNEYDMATIERDDDATKAELDRLRRLPENRHCADCGKRETAWASVNLGVFLCIQCGSHHRGIGTHISKPKGCTGTYLWGPDEMEQMRSIGNERAAQMYGANSEQERPGPNASDAVWRQFLVQKYEQTRFAPAPSLQQDGMDFFQQHHPSSGSPSSKAKTKTTIEATLARGDLMSFLHDSPTTKGVLKPTFIKKSDKNEQTTDFFAEFGV